MESSTNEVSGFTELTHLSAEKLQPLDAVLKSILALPIAHETFAQIIDGNTWNSNPGHRARGRYKEFIKQFSADILKLDTRVC